MSAKRHRACYCARIDNKGFCTPMKKRALRRVRTAARRGSKVTRVRRYKTTVCMGYFNG